MKNEEVIYVSRSYKIEVPVSPEWKQLIKKREKMKGFKSTAEYVRHLIRKDLEAAKLLEVVAK